MKDLKSRLDDESAEAIIDIKEKLIKKNGFTPPYASFHVYDCCLNKNITSFEEISRYLTEQGIGL